MISATEHSLTGSILGIDEAGRGPLIGPLVVAGYVIRDKDELNQLKNLGVADSKKLTAQKREKIFEALDPSQFKTIQVSPQTIDSKSITELEIEAIRILIEHYNSNHIIIDAPVHPSAIPALKTRLLSFCRAQAHLRHSDSTLRKEVEDPPMAGIYGSTSTNIILENKADAKYLTCMAASIVAKVTRDRAIAKLRQIFGDFGSGYPSDPKTRAFVSQLSGGQLEQFSPNIRFKWSTASALVVSRKQ